MTKTFTLTYEQIDSIIIEELKEAHDSWITINRDEGGTAIEPDWEVISAIEKVLEIYMPSSDYQRWIREAALKKLTLTSELIGGYEL